MKNLWIFLLASLLHCVEWAACAWRWVKRYRRGKGRGVLEVHPDYSALLAEYGLDTPEAFLALCPTIISGHPDRNVGRLTLGRGDEAVTIFLKREHSVPWKVRLLNALEGFGLASRSAREAQTLQALEREGFGAPRCLAVGESGDSAFIVLESVSGVEVREFIRRIESPACRAGFLRQLGREVARLHACGFDHPDLYSKHVLVDDRSGRIVFLDWQRCRRQHPLPWNRRLRSLAALHATVAEDVATDRERLVFWRAYLGATDLPRDGAEERRLLGELLAMGRRLLRKRHVAEKRQRPLSVGEQNWTRVDGEALCVSSGYHEAFPDRGVDWLELGRLESGGRGVERRWVTTEGGESVLWVGRTQRDWIPDARAWLRGTSSPEQRQATLLLRLQRHHVPAPAPLAVGQQALGWGNTASFLLMKPSSSSLRLDVWLERMARLHPDKPGVRRDMLFRAGQVVRRLHDASCYFGEGEGKTALAVFLAEDDGPTPGLQDVDDVRSERQARADLAERDVAGCLRWLAEAGSSAADLREFLEGYRRPHENGGGRLSGLAQWERVGEEGGAYMAEVEASDVRETRHSGSGGAEGWVEQMPLRQGLWSRLVRGACRLIYRRDWEAIAGRDWRSTIMCLPVTDRFSAKQGRSTGRVVLEAPPTGGVPARRLVVYLKRHYHLPWRARLLALLRPSGGWSPAMQEAAHLEWARGQGIPVPRVAAAGEFIGPGLCLQSFLAVEELTGMLPLNEAIPLAAKELDPEDFRRWKAGLICEIARLTRILHDRRHFHKDLYLCHFFIREDDLGRREDWRGRVHLIDLHRLSRHTWTRRIWQIKDLAQLLFSSEIAGVDDRDRLRFWNAYLGGSREGTREKWLRYLIMFKWRRYRRHNQRLAMLAGTAVADDISPPSEGASRAA